MTFKRSAAVIGAILALWVAAWLGAPPLIKWQAQQRLSESLGRSVTLGSVQFTPWPLTLTLSDVVIGAAEPASAPASSAPPASGALAPAPPPGGGAIEPLLRVARLHVRADLWPLLRGLPVVQSLELDAPQVHVARLSAGHYDFDDLLGRISAAPGAPPSEPARFALYNVQVRNGQLHFDDRPLGRLQRVDALQLSLPFISNLPDAVKVEIEPHLEFTLNGAHMASAAQAEPFAPTRPGTLNLAVTNLDLGPYVGYLPASLPVHLARGIVTAELNLRFSVADSGAPSVTLAGKLDASDVALTDPTGGPLAGWKRLQLDLRDVQPLARKLAFGTLRVDALQAHAVRDAAGQINLLTLGATPHDATPAAAAPPAPAASAAPSWQVGVDTLELVAAQILWNDAAVTPAAALQLDGLMLNATQVRWPSTAPIALRYSGALRAQDSGAPTLARFDGDAAVTDHEARLGLHVDGLALGTLRPYLSDVLAPSLDGTLTAQAQLDWSSAAASPRLRMALDTLTLDAVALREGAKRGAPAAVAMQRLALAGLSVDLLGHSVEIAQLHLVQPAVALTRGTDGAMNWQGWLRGASPAPAGNRAQRGAHAASSPGVPWRVKLKSFQLDGGQADITDAAVVRGSGTQPLHVSVAGLHVSLQDLDWLADRPAAPVALQITARVGAAPGDRARVSGTLDYKGHVSLQPLLATGRLRIERLPLALFAPYVAGQLPIALLRADLGYNGTLALHALPAGLDVAAGGDVRLADVHVATLSSGAARASPGSTDELLSWESLALTGVTFAMKPAVKPRLDIAAAALNNFYSRLIVTEQGRFNLQELAPTSQEAPPANGDAAALDAVAASAPASAPAATDTGLPLDVRVGATTLTNGRIDFTDHFVGPGYSAALTELNGRLGAFDSASRNMATLELHGRAEGTATLEIGGSINPAVRPLALDIQAKASDLELAPLSPYSGKYAGYAIERGKLSMNVAYKIDADGKLEASNQVVLNQLTFGDKVESKDATSLPVRLAVALLKDRNGVIDVNLPISGSINDPKFSLGGIIVKVIVNLLTKAITAPFALLSGGGSQDLSMVEFQPGTAVMVPGGASAIDKVAQALTDRPSLKMTVVGTADPQSERDAMQDAAVQARLRAQQRREALRADDTTAPPDAAVALPEDERNRLLKQIYKDTDLPDKPRNALGLAKDLPPADMLTLLKAHTTIDPQAVRDLAEQRAVAVRDALVTKGLPSERLFLAAPKLRDPSDGQAAWTPRVQLTLATN